MHSTTRRSLSHVILLRGTPTPAARAKAHALLNAARLYAATSAGHQASVEAPEHLRETVRRAASAETLAHVSAEIEGALNGEPVEESTARTVAAALTLAGCEATAVARAEYLAEHAKHYDAATAAPWWARDAAFTDEALRRIRRDDYDHGRTSQHAAA